MAIPLFHATFKANAASIGAAGIIPGGVTRLYPWASPDFVYLSSSKALAESFVDIDNIECSDAEYDEFARLIEDGVAVYEIDSSILDPDKFGVDPNYNGDSGEIECYAYKGIVPFAAITEVHI